MARTPVLIVGAGPTGLMLALQLARRGVAMRIIDRNDGPAHESRAVVVQARTLEFFQQLGFGDRAVREGRRLERLVAIRLGRVRARLEIGRAGIGLSRYPFVLALGQDQTEGLLLEKLGDLGIHVERGREAVSIEDHGDRMRVGVRRSRVGAGDPGPTGPAPDEWIDADWLCGCDGASSAVRHAMQVPFEGGTYENRFYLADCRVDGPVADDGVTLCLGRDRFAALFAMHGERRFRVIGRLEAPLEDAASVTLEQVAPLVEEALQRPVTLSAPRWTSIYRLHHRCAARVRAGTGGRAFLLGDALHVHSPAGGQGMNTGLQDAVNLAWKLALVCHGRADAALLDSCHDERHPVAERLLRTTDRIFGFATRRGGVARAVRSFVVDRVMAPVMGVAPLRVRIFRLVSQIDIAYDAAPMAALARSLGALAGPPWPGERLPHALFAGADGVEREVADLCRGRWFTLLCLGFDRAEGDALLERVERGPLAGLVAVEPLPATSGSAPAFAALGVHDPPDRLLPRLLAVRPDLHVLGAWPAGDAAACLHAIERCARLRTA